MTFSMLTTSGWVWFVWVMAEALTFIAWPKSRRATHALLLAVEIAWLLWLMTP